MNAAERARIIIDEVSTSPRDKIPTRVLALLVLLDDGPRNIGEIVDLLGIAQASASELVTKAEDLGLVERYRWWSDHRIVRVALTARGRQVRRRRRGDR